MQKHYDRGVCAPMEKDECKQGFLGVSAVFEKLFQNATCGEDLYKHLNNGF